MEFHLTAVYIIFLPILGVMVGLLGTLAGVGGGFILVPLLFLLFPGASPATITSISLTVVLVNALSATAGNLRARRLDTRTAILLMAGAIPGSVGGAVVVSLVGRDHFEFAFAVLLLVAALYVFWRSVHVITTTPATVAQINRFIQERSGDTYRFHVNNFIAAIIGPLEGFVSTFFGIGGGILHVPAMLFILKIPPRIAAATSLLVLVFTASAGVFTHLVTGSYQEGWRRAGLLALGAFLGAQLGLHLIPRVNQKLVLRVLAAAIAVVAVREFMAGLV